MKFDMNLALSILVGQRSWEGCYGEAGARAVCRDCSSISRWGREL